MVIDCDGEWRPLKLKIFQLLPVDIHCISKKARLFAFLVIALANIHRSYDQRSGVLFLRECS